MVKHAKPPLFPLMELMEEEAMIGSSNWEDQSGKIAFGNHEMSSLLLNAAFLSQHHLLFCQYLPKPPALLRCLCKTLMTCKTCHFVTSDVTNILVKFHINCLSMCEWRIAEMPAPTQGAAQ